MSDWRHHFQRKVKAFRPSDYTRRRDLPTAAAEGCLLLMVQAILDEIAESAESPLAALRAAQSRNLVDEILADAEKRHFIDDAIVERVTHWRTLGAGWA